MIDPIAFYIPIIDWPVHWYGLSYAFAVLITVFWLPSLLEARGMKNISKEKIWDLVFIIFVFAIVGARLGEWLFYHPEWIQSPLQILKVWEGGMSFHGGLIGGFVAGFFAARKYDIPLGKLSDALVLPLSVSLVLGRFANFINGELVGKVTDLKIGMDFPGWAGKRHPSQLYEMGKNLLLTVIFMPMVYRNKSWADGTLFSLWVMGYGVLRFIVEFWREPDWIWFGLSGGQWLCLVMILTGRWLVVFVNKRSDFNRKK